MRAACGFSQGMLVRTVVWGVGFIQGCQNTEPLDPSACRALEVVQSRGDLQQAGAPPGLALLATGGGESARKTEC